MKVVVVNFFPAFFPPKSGGELRYYHLYRELGLHCKVELVSTTYPFVQPETVQIADGVVEYRIPKGNAHVALHRLLDRVAGFDECSGVVVSIASRMERNVREEIRRRCEGADVVIYDTPFLYPLAKLSHPGAILVYSAHNVELDMQRACLPGPVGFLLARHVRRLESRLCQDSELIFAPSQADITRFVELYGIPPQKCSLAPNGVNVAEIPVPNDTLREQSRAALELDGRRVVLFLGSYHPPNLEAARYILRHLAPAFPSELFVIAGGVARGLNTEHIPANVVTIGRYSEDAKRLLLTAADIALNPMFAGSGTNLKTLEYLVYGVPTLTTSVGARGLDLSSGRHALVADIEEFPSALETLLDTKDLRLGLRTDGRKLVEERFDWRAIAAAMYAQLSASVGQKKKPQLTVLNDFPCFPPTHGGRVRLYNFYRNLASHYDIDYLCYDDTGAQVATVHELGANGFREVRVPKTRLQTMIERILMDMLGFSAADVVAMLISPLDRRFRRIASYSIQRSNLVIASHMYLYSIAARFRGDKIYDSLNCEYELKRKVLTSWLGKLLLPLIKRQEAKACRDSSHVFATSAEDAEDMIRLYGVNRAKFLAVPNGVNVSLCEPMDADERQRAKTHLGIQVSRIVTFVASAHPPNAEAALWIAKELAPSLGEGYRVFIIGSACWALNHKTLPPNLTLFYEVEEAIKRELLRVTDIAINPVVVGSGTNLKMLEYMAWGLPVVTTITGTRGLALAHNVQVVISDRRDFAKAIHSLALNPQRCRSIGMEGRALVESRFDWSWIAASILESLPGGRLNATPSCHYPRSP